MKSQIKHPISQAFYIHINDYLLTIIILLILLSISCVINIKLYLAIGLSKYEDSLLNCVYKYTDNMVSVRSSINIMELLPHEISDKYACKIGMNAKLYIITAPYNTDICSASDFELAIGQFFRQKEIVFLNSKTEICNISLLVRHVLFYAMLEHSNLTMRHFFYGKNN